MFKFSRTAASLLRRLNCNYHQRSSRKREMVYLISKICYWDIYVYRISAEDAHLLSSCRISNVMPCRQWQRNWTWKFNRGATWKRLPLLSAEPCRRFSRAMREMNGFSYLIVSKVINFLVYTSFLSFFSFSPLTLFNRFSFRTGRNTRRSAGIHGR